MSLKKKWATGDVTILIPAHPFAMDGDFVTRLVRGMDDIDGDGRFFATAHGTPEVVLPKGMVTGLSLVAAAQVPVDVRDVTLVRSNISVGGIHEVL